MARATRKRLTVTVPSALRRARRRAAFAAFLADEQGQAATEYVLVIGLFVLFIVVAYNSIQGALRELVTRVAALLSGPGI